MDAFATSSSSPFPFLCVNLSQVHDHFRPSSKLFPDHRKWDFRVFLSTVGCLATLAGLFMLGDAYGHKKISMMYWPA